MKRTFAKQIFVDADNNITTDLSTWAEASDDGAPFDVAVYELKRTTRVKICTVIEEIPLRKLGKK
ncbi:MAG: hypothetical protein WC455_12405 [Dehalococcoidia bacterium]|jgi:hypothetical protein